MPVSKPPRRRRGVPQYQRDLKRMETPMSTVKPAPARLGRFVALGAGTAVVGGALAARQGKVNKTSTQTVTNVRRVTPRTRTGQFVSHVNDLMYITPKSFIGKRPPRDSALQVWHKKGVKKADPSPLATAFAAGGARRGKRLV